MNRADFFIINNSFYQGGYIFPSSTKVNSSKIQKIKFNETVPLMDLPESLNCRAFGSDLIFCVSFVARTIPYIMPSPGSIIPVITLPRYGCDKTVMFKVPVLDSFGTELAGIAMKIKYTIRAIDFISSKTGSLSQITDSKSLSLGASIDPAKIMSKESFGTYSAEYVQSLQKALVFHVELGKK